jgi:GT2 family glycosyltransferase
MHSIAFVVPTKDRPDDLRKMLQSLAVQTRLPDQLIIVDGSDPPIKQVTDSFPQLNIDYVRVFPPSLAAQRNAGMRQLRPEITLAGYLDDDVVVEPEAVAAMLDFWERGGTELGGVSFLITNNPHPGGLWLKRLFLVEGPIQGKMLPSGFPTSFFPTDTDIEAQWLCGGATVWRRTVIDRTPYDEWFVGTGFMEDVDYSFTVGAKHRLAVCASARLAHYSHPIRADRYFLLGFWQVVNRMYIVRKHASRGLSIMAAWWATAGLVLLNFAAALRYLDSSYWNRVKGNIAGIWSEFKGERRQIGGHLK